MNSDATKHFELGKTKFFRFDRKGAVEELQKASTLEPNDSRIRGWLAITYIFLEKFDDAIDLLENIGSNECGEYYIGQGLIHERRDKNYQLAIEEYTKAISIDPNDEFVYVMRSTLYSIEDKLTDALSDLDTAIEINGTSYVHLIYGQLYYFDLKDNNRALEFFNKSIDLDPNKEK